MPQIRPALKKYFWKVFLNSLLESSSKTWHVQQSCFPFCWECVAQQNAVCVALSSLAIQMLCFLNYIISAVTTEKASKIEKLCQLFSSPPLDVQYLPAIGTFGIDSLSSPILLLFQILGYSYYLLFFFFFRITVKMTLIISVVKVAVSSVTFIRQ